MLLLLQKFGNSILYCRHSGLKVLYDDFSRRHRRKAFNDCNGDYEGTVAKKTSGDCSDKKRLTEFCVEIKAMIDNDPSSQSANIGGTKFLIKLLVQEDILCFAYKWRKSKFSLQARKGKKKDCTAHLLKKLKHSLQPKIIWFFQNERKQMRWSNKVSTKQPLASYVSTRCMNQESGSWKTLNLLKKKTNTRPYKHLTVKNFLGSHHC